MVLMCHCCSQCHSPLNNNRDISMNLLTVVDVGLFDTNTALTWLYVDHACVGEEVGVVLRSTVQGRDAA